MWPRPGIPAAFPWRLEGWPEPRPRRSGAEGAFRAVVQSGQTISYGYDVIGRRLSRTLNNGTAWTGFVHAGGMEIGEINSAGQYLVRYVPGPGVDQREAMIVTNPSTGAATDRFYYHANRLGSVIALANQAGALTDRYVYTPYGVEAPLNTSGNPFRYTGRRYDPESKLYYYRARYYWPEIGRFLETDPIGYADQMNLYAYVGNNPLNATDPTGMRRQDDDVEFNFRCEDGGCLSDFGETQHFDDVSINFVAPGPSGQPIQVPTWADSGRSSSNSPNSNGSGSGWARLLGLGGRISPVTAPLALGGSSVQLQGSMTPEDSPLVLFHYTNEAGMNGILASGVILPSLYSEGTRDVLLGEGVYLSEIVPGSRSNARLGAIFKRVPNAHIFTHYVAVEMRGLPVWGHPARQHVFVVPTTQPLPVRSRIIAAGSNE